MKSKFLSCRVAFGDVTYQINLIILKNDNDNNNNNTNVLDYKKEFLNTYCLEAIEMRKN